MRRNRIFVIWIVWAVLAPAGYASDPGAQPALEDHEVCAFVYKNERYTVTREECKKAFLYRMYCGYNNPQSPGEVKESELPEAKQIVHEAVAMKVWMLENDLIGKPTDNPHVHAREMEFELYLNEQLKQIPIEISESEIERYYQERRKFINSPRMTKIKWIHIAAEQSESGKYSDGALKQAEIAAMQAWERIQKGEDFDQVMEEVSPEGWQGELDYQPQGPRGVFIDRAVNQLEIGQVSQPVRGTRGYSIIKLLGIRDPRPLSLEEVRPQIERVLKQNAFRDNRETLVSELAVQHIIQLDPQKEAELAVLF